MKNWLMALAGLSLMLAIAAGCASAASTSTPSPTVAYVEGRFESGSTTGKDITVPVGSPVGVHVVLDATGNMDGELKVVVWKAIALSPDTSVQTCAKTATLHKGTQEVYACEFTAEDLTSRKFTHYYLKAYWSGAPLTVEPRIGEGVRTVSGHTTMTPTPTPTPPLPDKSEGILTGSVTIGPLCPVEPCAEPLGDVYASRELLLRQEGRESIRIPLGPDGSFAALLPAGYYEVDVTDCDFLGCSFALPVTITIEDGQTTTLGIDIDTGIRSPSGLGEQP
ncbi:MAG: hypothetical protein ACE5JL_03940 [Dehalococcoidia bacterium]